MQRAPLSWVIDPSDPRAPPQELWDRMPPDERQRVLDALPSEFELTDASPPPEGDFHFNPKVAARDTLGGYFQRLGRRVYLACELPIYYPGQRMFAPDVLAVLDVELKERSCWSVSAEGKGLDLALEIVWSGKARKDLEVNVARYADLGIPEYFVFERKPRRLRGFQLAPGGRRYQPILPQQGRLRSAVLDLELGLEGDRLRFFHGAAPLPETSELLARLGALVGDLETRLEESEQRAEEAQRQADENQRQAQRQADEARRQADEARQQADEARRQADENQRQAQRKAEQSRRQVEETQRQLAEALAEVARLKGQSG